MRPTTNPTDLALTESPLLRDPYVASDAYVERVYAGVLGKLIGVYLGRPVENWSYERIAEEFGTIEYYIHEQRGRLLIVTDDDISGTFTFLRALRDYDCDPNLSPKQIGQTWLNYLIEKTTILWWGGLGNSTEHTAYLRLKRGIEAPRSGSMELNSKVVAEQIGAQIFIDGWGLICPGDPLRAADFARRAASVSHDGEAVYAAQVVAAMVAAAFTESTIDAVVDRAVAVIPPGCEVARLIRDLREWHAADPDWRENRARLAANYGYDRYQGQCHVMPNHGLIILSLLHGGGDFDESMKIVNTCGWDTDCNSGNVGTVVGVLGGLPCFEGRYWRGPVADRLYLPSADGGRAITDAVREAIEVANLGRALASLPPVSPKNGARFHFSLPGSVQGWQGTGAQIENSKGRLRITPAAAGTARAAVATFVPREIRDLQSGYVLVASPTLYPGHEVTIDLVSLDRPVCGRLNLTVYDADDEPQPVEGPAFALAPGEEAQVRWTIPDTGGYPIHDIGLSVEGGPVEIDRADWQGVPRTSFPPVDGVMWTRAWARGIDRFGSQRDRYEWLVNNEGPGVLITGCREWTDYRVRARLTPKMAVAAGLAVRVQGLRRYYAVLFCENGELRIDKELDGRTVLATTRFAWEPYRDYEVAVEVRGNEIRAWIDGELRLSAQDADRPLREGAFGFAIDTGCLGAGTPSIEPL